MYATGSVNTLADLLTAIRAACTANGWTLSGNVLHKGAVYVETLTASGFISFKGGTGIDGGNNLTGAGPGSVKLFPFGQAFTFPMTYEVFINTAPDEVYVVVNYSVDFYQWAGFGISGVSGLPGTGVWYAASQAEVTAAGLACSLNPLSVATSAFSGPVPVLFAVKDAGNNVQNAFVHHGLDGGTWNVLNGADVGFVAFSAMQRLMRNLPSQWNDETVLLPIHAWLPRASGKCSLTVDPKHAKYARIDFHDPGDIITLGSDTWKIYPCYRKDSVERDGEVSSPPAQHSGTIAWAVRYTP